MFRIWEQEHSCSQICYAQFNLPRPAAQSFCMFERLFCPFGM